MLRVWVLIVFSETYSSLPISRSDSREDSSRSTVSSRSESSSALSAAGDLRLAVSSVPVQARRKPGSGQAAS